MRTRLNFHETVAWLKDKYAMLDMRTKDQPVHDVRSAKMF